MVFQNYPNLIEMTSNIIDIVAFGVGFKCPRKIHLNTQCPLSDPPTALPRYMNFSFENKNPNQKPSIFPALIILPGTHRRYKNEKPSIKWVLFTNASHNTILHFVAIRFMSIQMLKSTQCTEVGFTNWYSCNKITKTQIQISRQNLFWVFLNMQQSHNVLT